MMFQQQMLLLLRSGYLSGVVTSGGDRLNAVLHSTITAAIASPDENDGTGSTLRDEHRIHWPECNVSNDYCVA